jgi:hypothetical protein
MATPKKVPVEVLEKAESVALTKRYTLAQSPKAAAPAPGLKKKPAKEKVVAALKRLHPMD